MTTIVAANGWIESNLALLRNRYPGIEVRVDGGVNWIRIAKMTLSTSIWSVDNVEVAFRIPNNAGEAPYGFWTHPGLTLRSGVAPNNYSYPSPTPWGPDWGQFSFAPEDPWQPKADVVSGVNMLDFVRGIDGRLVEGA